MKKRTDFNFDKHELLVYETDVLKVHQLKLPDTVTHNIKFINTGGVLTVTGDYSNWVFCREFHPTENDHAETMYWTEKLKISSCQEVSKYDSFATENAIQEKLKELQETSVDEEVKEYFEKLLTCVNDELEYTYQAFRGLRMPRNWDHGEVPFVKTINYQFLVILDAFDEICKRLKNTENRVTAIEQIEVKKELIK